MTPIEKAFEEAREEYRNVSMSTIPAPTDAIKRSIRTDLTRITITLCDHCKGKGKVIRKHHKSKKKARKKCPECNGSGVDIRYHVPDNVVYARRIEYGKEI